MSLERNVATRRSYLRTDKYEDAVRFLENFVHMVIRMNIDGCKGLKPVQRGIHVTSTAIMQIVEDLLGNRHFDYVLGSRLTNDCLENLFSCVHAKNPNPSPFEVKLALKIITLSQFFMTKESSSYDDDDREYVVTLSDFKRRISDNLSEVEAEDVEAHPRHDLEDEALSEFINNLDIAEINGLAYLGGFCLRKTVYEYGCAECEQFYVLYQPSGVRVRAFEHADAA